MLAGQLVLHYFYGVSGNGPDEIILVFVGELGQAVNLSQNYLFQKVQPDIMGRAAFPKSRVVILTAEKLDLMVLLIEVKIEIAATLGAFQQSIENAGFLTDRWLFASCSRNELLHLFPCFPVNDCLMDIEKDCFVLLWVLDPLLHLVGLRIGFEVDYIAAVFLTNENLCSRNELLHLFPCFPVNDCLMDIEKDCFVLLWVLDPLLHLVGLRIGFEVDYIAAVFLTNENLLDCGMTPLRMILDNDGTVCWQLDMPAELPTKYTPTDVAKFSRWYLKDYPTYVYEHPAGLLVIGCAPDSLVKWNFSVDSNYISSLLFGPVFVIAANLLLFLVLLWRNTRKVERAISPILHGIEQISEGKEVSLPKGGELPQINEKLNRADAHLLKKEQSAEKGTGSCRVDQWYFARCSDTAFLHSWLCRKIGR